MQVLGGGAFSYERGTPVGWGHGELLVMGWGGPSHGDPGWGVKLGGGTCGISWAAVAGVHVGGHMCLLVLAIKTFFSPTFDLPGEKNPGEVFTQIGRGNLRAGGCRNGWGDERTPVVWAGLARRAAAGTGG